MRIYIFPLLMKGLIGSIQLEHRMSSMQTGSFNPDEVIALLPLIEASVAQKCSEEKLTDEIAWTAVACLATAKLNRIHQAAA